MYARDMDLIYTEAAKLLLSITCYGGTSMVVINQTLDDALVDVLNVHPKLQNFVVVLLILFWLVKIGWYVIDKRLEYQERKQKMEIEREEHDDEL